ncbi:separin protein [Teratosphaeriaceae sp. CCFEE 6253]|nr:separin protein [Teratosphaeriaceae sp. CCFEE 6253]
MGREPRRTGAALCVDGASTVANASPADAVKAALASGSATPACVSALQKLLTPSAAQSPPPAPPTASVKGSVRDVRKTKASTLPTGRDRANAAQQPVQVREDSTAELPPRAAYVLATDVVNTTLKVLTAAARARLDVHITAREGPAALSTSEHPTRAATSPLQQRSANSTPVPLQAPGKPKLSTTQQDAGSGGHLVASAECARLAFSYLRSPPAHKLASKSQCRWQLETGMLAFAEKLVTLGMDALAVKELRILKRRLQGTMLVGEGEAPSSQAAKAIAPVASERETLASLLTMTPIIDADALGLAIPHQLLVLKIITASRRPALIEAALDHLRPSQAGSPVALIMHQAKTPSLQAKSAKQLEIVAQLLLSLCPSVYAGHGKIDLDHSLWPSLTAIFELQIIALQCRQKWWKLAGHRADPDKELVQPFMRSLAALVRKSDTAYRVLELDTARGGPDVDLGLCKTMAALATECGNVEQALPWLERMELSCASLEPRHARRVACLVKRVNLLPGHESREAVTATLSIIAERLRAQPSGQSADYDLLLVELSGLADVRRHMEADLISTPAELQAVVVMAAEYAQRYARSYPGRQVPLVQAIIEAAVAQSSTSEALQKWVTQDAARVYVNTGSLHSVAEAAAHRPMAGAWLVSGAAVAFDKILQALVVRYVRQAPDEKLVATFDDETLSDLQRAALLERQFCHACKMANRSKYTAGLRKLVPDVLHRLSKLYSRSGHPLHRTRIATAALCLYESHPELLEPHALEVWLEGPELSTDHLGVDAGLQAYVSDVSAGWAVVKAFHAGRPTRAALWSSLLAWERIVDSSASLGSLCARIYDVETLRTLLHGIATYFQMLGFADARLYVLRLLHRVIQLSGPGADSECLSAIELVRQYLVMGYSGKASALLSEARTITGTRASTALTKLHLSVAHAEFFHAIDDFEEAGAALDEARLLRDAVAPEVVARDQRRAYELLHAQAWLVQSKVHRDTGAPSDALKAAKHAVRFLTATWSAIEYVRDGKLPEKVTDVVDAPKPDMAILTSGVSKLQLTSKEPASGSISTPSTHHGARFWAVSPVSCCAMMHLSDMYAHHGLFASANYYSERAVGVAESVQSAFLVASTRIHRSRLLTLANRLEDAELCLTRSEEGGLDQSSLPTVDYLTAKAELRTKEGSYSEAAELYSRAISIVDQLRRPSYLLGLGQSAVTSPTPTEGLLGRLALDAGTRTETARSGGVTVSVASARAVQRPPSTTTKRTASAKKASVLPKGSTAAHNAAARPVVVQDYPLDRRRAEIGQRCALVCLQAGSEPEPWALSTPTVSGCTGLNGLRRHIDYRTMMRRLALTLQSDVSYSSLPESTLSYPSLLRTDGAAASLKTAVRKRSADDRVETLISKARDCLVADDVACQRLLSTAELHKEYSMLTYVTILLSAVVLTPVPSRQVPALGAFYVELPGMNAAQREAAAVVADHKQLDNTSPFVWPTSEAAIPSPVLGASQFQQSYVDVLPETWTAVSICLSDDCSELYVARYAAARSPLILKLPFSRLKEVGSDDDSAFTYRVAKAEIEDIIQASNYSCHNSGVLEGSGAKGKWWKEREELDRRLHELLINMEDVWFGGFKGVLAQHALQADLMARFSASFEDILSRYLPSRLKLKGKQKPLALDTKVLELFVGLGSGHEGSLDLDEPLTDLLYFVVDMLQFSGERNAYDEIDFDGMTIDVLDALRSYQEACPESSGDPRHLVLLLDKRLQAFPWENLPCLEGSSVSRVNSMLSLRDCILAMRCQQQTHVAGPIDTEGRHFVDRRSGTYILNPSKDLVSTQAALSTALSSLSGAGSAHWQSMVEQQPSEDMFSAALTDSSILLYFGHGAGSQYIRPRTIERLGSCSEVVWLMGCSSGAVTEYGELEPSAVPFAYLRAGASGESKTTCGGDDHGAVSSKKCLAVVATLWDVTDKDIDRFSLALGEDWGLWPTSEESKLPTKTPKKRERLVAPSTPLQVPKTPRMAKARKTPAKTQSYNRPRTDGGQKRSLAEAVAKSRDACYLRYLNGAAPVVYGVPVYLGD